MTDADEQPPAVAWLPWYFSRGFGNFLTIPLFVLLAASLLISIAGALLQAVSYWRASYAVYGLVGLAIVQLVAWVPVILPPALYYSLLRNMPGLWMAESLTRKVKFGLSALLVVGFFLVASAVFQGSSWAIGAIADQDVCASYAAGVTGSLPPSNCQ